ncbi:MAG: amino acid-binding protein [Verrucomicrobia bacterium]|nr:amino acid-binding protein [Verrucomicrobiota bacterium]
MTVKQLSIFLENKPGTLTGPCRLLAEAGINIQTFALADTKEFGILRLIVHEWEKAKQVLEQNGCVVRITDVVALEVPDHPGGLVHLLEILEQAGVNVEYTYAFTDKLGDRVLLAFRFGDNEAAVKALQAAKVNVLGTTELARRLNT